MDEMELRLDGNAAAGVLRELFMHEMSAARGQCAACGAIMQLGNQHLYASPRSPGAVLRCASCEEVLLVVVHADGWYRLGTRGLVWLEILDEDQRSLAPGR
jgi:hypothetical protein